VHSKSNESNFEEMLSKIIESNSYANYILFENSGQKGAVLPARLVSATG